MRNLTIYLVLLLCLFASKMLAQDPRQKGEQEKQTFQQAMEKQIIKYEQIKKEEEKIYEEESGKLKTQRRKGNITKQEFKDQEIALKKKKESNVKERINFLSKDLREQFPEMGEETFEGRAEQISTGIKSDVREEKELLKKEIEAVDKLLVDGTITKTQAEEQKLKVAETSAKAIEEKVKLRQEDLNKLIQDDVDKTLPRSWENKGLSLTLFGDNIEGDIKEKSSFSFPAMKAYNGQKDKDRQQNKRTSSQFVYAIGVSNLATKGAVENSDFRYWQSRFYEWGLTFNSRIIPNHNLLHLKYGFSVMYNTIRPTDNRYFVPGGNGQTNLEVFPYEIEDSRFKNVYLVAPLHVEFDFSGNKSKNDNTGFSTHKGVRFGIGGYGGFRIKSKQKIYYDSGDDKVRIKTKGDFNANDFIYGVSSYLGYKSTSLYLKYDLNPLFENNTIDQNNISLGVRFDFN